MPTLARTVLIALAVAAGTWFLGWWTVPAIALGWGLVAPAPRLAAREATLGAVLAWGALLLYAASAGPVGALATRLGGVMGLPAPALYFVTLLFPAGLAWSLAALASSSRARVTTARTHATPPVKAPTSPVRGDVAKAGR